MWQQLESVFQHCFVWALLSVYTEHQCEDIKYNQEASQYFMVTKLNFNRKVVIKLGFQMSIMYYSNLIITKVFKELNMLSAFLKKNSFWYIAKCCVTSLFNLHSLQFFFRNWKNPTNRVSEIKHRQSFSGTLWDALRAPTMGE